MRQVRPGRLLKGEQRRLFRVGRFKRRTSPHKGRQHAANKESANNPRKEGMREMASGMCVPFTARGGGGIVNFGANGPTKRDFPVDATAQFGCASGTHHVQHPTVLLRSFESSLRAYARSRPAK